MSTEQKSQHILIELAPVRGEREVSLSFEDISDRSAKAMSFALNSIRSIASSVVETVTSLPSSTKPSKVQVELGLKFTADAKAIIVQSGTEAHVNVTLEWEKEDKESN